MSTLSTGVAKAVASRPARAALREVAAVMPFNLFGMRGNLKRLNSSEELDPTQFERILVELDKSEGDLGLTVGNTEDGSGVLIVAVGQNTISRKANIQPGQVIFKVNEHEVRALVCQLAMNASMGHGRPSESSCIPCKQVGTHAEAVALMDKAANGKVRLELSKIEAHPDTIEEVLRSPHRSNSAKNLNL